MNNHLVDILFETESNGYDNVFHEIFSSKHAPVSVFKTDKDLSKFETNVKSLFELELLVPFSGEVQITTLQYSNNGDLDSSSFENDVETTVVENAKTVSKILIQSLKNEDDFCWVDNYKYLGDGKLLIFINEHENDFIRFNEPLYDTFLDDGYIIESFANDHLHFQKDQKVFRLETYCYEPLIITINYYHEELDSLNEQEVRSEIAKFIPGFSNWNCIPAFFNDKTYSLIANFDWGWIDKDSKIINRFDGDFLSAKATKFLSSQRNEIQFQLNLNVNPMEKLVLEINKTENFIFGQSYMIDLEDKNEEDLDLTKTPNGFKGFKFQQVVLEAKDTGDSIGSIFLWSYIISESIVTVEYSIQKTTEKLIMNIPFETTSLK
jgi:hypothetical protein